MSKITPDHLARSAFVYIRQSTSDQPLHNHESRRRQYALADRARQYGWQDVVVMMIWGVPARRSAGPASNGSWRRFARDGWGRCLQSKRRDWHATVVAGTR